MSVILEDPKTRWRSSEFILRKADRPQGGISDEPVSELHKVPSRARSAGVARGSGGGRPRRRRSPGGQGARAAPGAWHPQVAFQVPELENAFLALNKDTIVTQTLDLSDGHETIADSASWTIVGTGTCGGVDGAGPG